MKILVINAGSSSLKYQLFDMDTEQMLCKGNCERIGGEGSFIGHKTADGREMKREGFSDYISKPMERAALEKILLTFLPKQKITYK